MKANLLTDGRYGFMQCMKFPLEVECELSLSGNVACTPEQLKAYRTPSGIDRVGAAVLAEDARAVPASRRVAEVATCGTRMLGRLIRIPEAKSTGRPPTGRLPRRSPGRDGDATLEGLCAVLR